MRLLLPVPPSWYEGDSTSFHPSLFAHDLSMASRSMGSAMGAVYGKQNPVQRRRIHKIRTLHETEKSLRKIMGFKDIWRLDAALKKDIDNSEKSA